MSTRLRVIADTVALGTDKQIASSSPLVWSPDGAEVLVGLRPDRCATEARAAFVALTEAPVILQDSRNDFLAWDRVRNLAAKQITALVSLENGDVREILSGALSEGGREGFCGWLDDRFGVSWQVIPANLGEIMSADPKRVMEALLTMGRIDISALREAGSEG